MGTVVSVGGNWERRAQTCKVHILLMGSLLGKNGQLIVPIAFYAYVYFLHLSLFVMVSKVGHH